MADTDIRILYIDDDEPNLDAFDLVLGKDYPILTAVDGPSALELLAREKGVGVAIVDWKLPGMNGSQVIHEIKAKYPEIICILFTAYISFELARASVDDPTIHKYVEKPMDFNSDEFRGILEEAKELHKKAKAK